MRRRHWITWLVFALGALLVVDVLGWATWRVLGLERAERLASARADAGRRERLVLWQMDSLVSAIVARESARPYFVYRPRYAADRPYDRAWAIDGSTAVQASPLAAGTGDPLIRLHYQIEPGEGITTPQTGDGLGDPEVVGQSPGRLRAARLLRELESTRVAQGSAMASVGRSGDMDTAAPAGVASAARPSEPEIERSHRADWRAERDAEQHGTPADSPEPVLEDPSGAEPDDAALRRQLFDIARQGHDYRQEPAALSLVEVGPFRPRWITAGAAGVTGEAPELVFERTVTVDGREHTQGFWIDWASLQAELLAVAVRLVRGASLEPVAEVDGHDLGMLATIPLRLSAPDPTATAPVSSPTRVTLTVTWIATLTALTAIGFILSAATRLADRRGRFVAVVTHELRSPLTTFRLYTDLLRARGDDPEIRARAIAALGRESSRLASVVENVLVYAGLTRHRAQAEPVRLGEILEPLLPTLRERVEREGGGLEVGVDDDASEAFVRAAPGSVERILTNLVDNACRYGLTAGSRVVRLTAQRGGGSVRIRVSDRGPGVRPGERERVFGDFTRGAQSNRSPEGMGLGLALARGLARASGGDLRLARTTEPGAAFELSLPEHGD